MIGTPDIYFSHAQHESFHWFISIDISGQQSPEVISAELTHTVSGLGLECWGRVFCGCLALNGRRVSVPYVNQQLLAFYKNAGVAGFTGLCSGDVLSVSVVKRATPPFLSVIQAGRNTVVEARDPVCKDASQGMRCGYEAQ